MPPQLFAQNRAPSVGQNIQLVPVGVFKAITNATKVIVHTITLVVTVLAKNMGKRRVRTFANA